MTPVTLLTKAASTNPLKSSQPLGAALAFLGIDGAMPLFHGSQGCTSFALVLLVRHFKETVPLQTTAMDEVATVLGGTDHLEEAILNLKTRTKPSLIGICTTALVETRGEDFSGDLTLIQQRHAGTLGETELILAQTPDFAGAMAEGWSKAVEATIARLVPPEPGRVTALNQINILPGQHHTVADVEFLRDSARAFGLEPVILPDISGSLDGTVPERWIPTTYGGTAVAAIRGMGRALHTVALAEHVRGAAALIEARTGVPFTVFDTLTGLKAADRYIVLLAALSRRPVPAALRRRRNQLQDALLDGHFHFGGQRIAIAAEPDLLFGLVSFFVGLGAVVAVAVTTTGDNPILARVPAEAVLVGDLGDLEARAGGCDLLVTHSHGRQSSERLGIPLMRMGFPIFDRLGSQHRLTIGYEGTRNLIFEVANLFQANRRDPTLESLNPFRNRGEIHDGPAQIAAR
ncbi:nitrogenase iron-molybdenum cofactor biosynthesis protein NifN [Methylobacterium nodulans]|uniref:Nitrogenase iron-molybdenum cofactor biosynthesis protein NifN n=1 Tax=Methylobacterium nodulans (strain LMG 21967 / CNCM I-2342 / ORS 2060) TaxID=460265 RepID=B8ITG3_METNO|nr:nitrogenase iron-molybdenum cofactor biosynthesis protein NifN [Methylobacterium nodulans]ACL58879.1 nitrogenase molybdenum-iron cofactor biosynthesis protein NifN [Methylobacterium nodulans ORS 2060]